MFSSRDGVWPSCPRGGRGGGGAPLGQGHPCGHILTHFPSNPSKGFIGRAWGSGGPALAFLPGEAQPRVHGCSCLPAHWAVGFQGAFSSWLPAHQAGKPQPEVSRSVRRQTLTRGGPWAELCRPAAGFMPRGHRNYALSHHTNPLFFLALALWSTRMQRIQVPPPQSALCAQQGQKSCLHGFTRLSVQHTVGHTSKASECCHAACSPHLECLHRHSAIIMGAQDGGEGGGGRGGQTCL